MGNEEIDITGDNNNILNWIWKNLVPQNGQAESVQGELLRAVEKLRWEAQENGNINWDESFSLFIQFISKNLLAENRFSAKIKNQIKNDLNRLNNFILPHEITDSSPNKLLPYTDDDLYNRICDCIVDFCKFNPNLIENINNPKQYR